MKTILLSFAFILLVHFPILSQSDNVVSLKNMQTLVGSWQGSLTYLDYTSGKPYTMPANIEVAQIGRSRQFLFSNSFPKEMGANWTDTITISEDGKMINNESVKSVRTLENGNLEIITEETGIDGNDEKRALFKHTYILGKDLFIQRKDVRFEGETEWIKRHEYNYPLRTK